METETETVGQPRSYFGISLNKIILAIIVVSLVAAISVFLLVLYVAFGRKSKEKKVTPCKKKHKPEEKTSEEPDPSLDDIDKMIEENDEEIKKIEEVNELQTISDAPVTADPDVKVDDNTSYDSDQSS
jgi:cytoskeletal protein RodZ